MSDKDGAVANSVSWAYEESLERFCDKVYTDMKRYEWDPHEVREAIKDWAGLEAIWAWDDYMAEANAGE